MKEARTAIYLAGHGSKSKPRFIELQYQRILRYREAFLHQSGAVHQPPAVFIDLRLPRYGMGSYDLDEVPAFKALHQAVQQHKFEIVYVDLDEPSSAFTPDYESAFVRSLLEAAGAAVLNAFVDDKGAFERELFERCGANARAHEVTDGSDFVTFFPSSASDIVTNAISREIGRSKDAELSAVLRRIDDLKKMRPYAGGGTPFVEPRLSADWQRSSSS
jgi:hypothetical protein